MPETQDIQTQNTEVQPPFVQADEATGRLSEAETSSVQDQLLQTQKSEIGRAHV